MVQNEVVIADPLAELTSPWEHDGLETLDPDSVAVQLFSLPSAAALTSWTVFRLGPIVRVQRLQAPSGQRVTPRLVFGADSVVEANKFFETLDELRSANLPHPSDSVVLDGVTYGVRDRETEDLGDLWWQSHQKPGDLTRCFLSLCFVLDDALPAYSTLD